MVTNRQTVVQPLGLVLTPNTYGQYPPGALSRAENVIMRAPGELWAAPGFSDSFVTSFINNDVLRKLMPLDAGHVYAWVHSAAGPWFVGESAIAGTTNVVTLPSVANTTGLWPDTGQIWPVRARERMLVNTATCGVFVGDSMAPTNSTQRALRSAGMPQPNISFAPTLVNAGTVPVGVLTGYAAILKRVFSDGYQIVSVPTPVYSEPPLGSIYDQIATVSWATNAGVIAGDIVEIYRTDGIPNGTQLGDPGDTLKLVVSYTLTAADIVAGQTVQRIQQTLTSPFYQTTGRELYTNPGQETALQSNRQPNICNAMAKFRNFVFYGDISERPAWTFTVPAGIANIGFVAPNTPFNRANMVGVRAGSGTITSGSNTITGVPAADLVGIVQGQIWPGGTGFVAGTTVSAVGASTITMSALANANASGWGFRDVIVIDGVSYSLVSDINLMNQLQTTGASKYEITTDNRIVDSIIALAIGTTYTIEPVRPNQATITVKATNGANYQPPVPEFTATAQTFSRKHTPNLLQWSKDSEPEHVPPSNETNVGAGTIIAMAATKNALWIFCTDGLYRLSGETPPWRIDLVDPSCILVAPQAATQLRDTIFAYTNYGMTAISDAGVDEFTTTTLNEVFTGPAYSGDPLTIVERNELDAEVIVSINDGLLYVFNTYQKAWTTLNWTNVTTSVTALAFQRSPASGPAVLLSGVSVPGFVPNYWQWNSPGVPYLPANVSYQPLFGDDPLVMKQYVDETFVFSSDSLINIVATEGLLSGFGTALLIRHGSNAMATFGFPRACAIQQQSLPGFATFFEPSTQFKFRGLSQRYVNMTDQAWRK